MKLYLLHTPTVLYSCKSTLILYNVTTLNLLLSDLHDYINYTMQQPFSILNTSLRGHNFHVGGGGFRQCHNYTVCGQ